MLCYMCTFNIFYLANLHLKILIKVTPFLSLNCIRLMIFGWVKKHHSDYFDFSCFLRDLTPYFLIAFAKSCLMIGGFTYLVTDCLPFETCGFLWVCKYWKLIMYLCFFPVHVGFDDPSTFNKNIKYVKYMAPCGTITDDVQLFWSHRWSPSCF